MKRETPLVTLIGMPAWVVAEPSHALAILVGVARKAEVLFSVYDLNIAFFKHLTSDEQRSWTGGEVQLWSTEPAAELWSKCELWFREQLDHVLAEQPKMVAFSVNMWTRRFSVEAARYIRLRSPETVLLFGGVDCFRGEENSKLLSPDSCDIICQGEAEVSFLKFLREYRETGRWQTMLPGFAYMDGDTVVDTGPVELPKLQDDVIQPDFSPFDLLQYTERGSLPFYFTRGCPFSCHFCSETTNFSRFRCRRPEEALQELVAGYRLTSAIADHPTFHLSDSIFNANVKRLEELADLIIASGLQFRWGGQGHLHHTFSDELIWKIAEAGFNSVFWGLESGSQRVVDLMKKAFRISDARRIVSTASRAGIAQFLPILCGFPGEEPEDFAETIEFMIEMRQLSGVTFLRPNPVLVRPNAALYEKYDTFALENNEYLEWRSVDGRNTYPVRLARCAVGSMARAELTPAALHEHERSFAQLPDLGSREVRDDLYRLIEEIYRRADRSPDFAAGILAAAENPHRELAACWDSLLARVAEAPERLTALIAGGLTALTEKHARSRRRTGAGFGRVERIVVSAQGVEICGWIAAPLLSECPSVQLCIGQRQAALTKCSIARPDVREGLESDLRALGFALVLSPEFSTPAVLASMSFRALTTDGQVWTLPVAGTPHISPVACELL